MLQFCLMNTFIIWKIINCSTLFGSVRFRAEPEQSLCLLSYADCERSRLGIQLACTCFPFSFFFVLITTWNYRSPVVFYVCVWCSVTIFMSIFIMWMIFIFQMNWSRETSLCARVCVSVCRNIGNGFSFSELQITSQIDGMACLNHSILPPRFFQWIFTVQNENQQTFFFSIILQINFARYKFKL